MDTNVSSKPLVCLLVADRPKLTAQTWKSLQGLVDSDVLVIDNGSGTETQTLLQELTSSYPLSGLRILRWSKRMPNIASAINVGLLVSLLEMRPMVVKVDNDMELPPAWDSEMLAVLRTHGVGCAAVRPDPGPKKVTLKEIPWKGKLRVQRPLSTSGVRWLWGAVQGLPRTVIEKLGYYDESLLREEDWDMSARVQQLGLNNFYLAKFVAKNLGQNESTEGMEQKRERASQSASVLNTRREKNPQRTTVWSLDAVEAATLSEGRCFVVPDDVMSGIHRAAQQRVGDALKKIPR